MTIWQTLTLSIFFLGTAQAAERTDYVQGSCHLVTMNTQGTVVDQQDFTLVPVDPWSHFGLALSGKIENFRVTAQLVVSNYDKIGAADWDHVTVGIDADGSETSQTLSGKTFAAGEVIDSALYVNHKELSCKVSRL
jgi:hypothetical protein